ncbi:hypothetical protein KQL42_004764 [Escherichia coli]|nr:hypothetical protein [Escherichia coli]EHP9779823.1 hypothetical protein [Escherichia coli]EHQ0026085.1 hypothetical protein [Escherichia coli]EHQ0056673.1 hypothetical protein [Escherichia coli]
MIYRLATPEDYEYIPEINLWELSFDKRPVKGVRCEDPVIGSQIYNKTRQKFISHKQTEKRRKQNFFRLKNISWDGIFDWCLSKGTSEECDLIIQLYYAKDKYEHYSILNKLKRHEGFFHESDLYLWICLFFISGNKIVSCDKLNLVKTKC